MVGFNGKGGLMDSNKMLFSHFFIHFFLLIKRTSKACTNIRPHPPMFQHPKTRTQGPIFLLSLIFPWIQKLHRKYSLTNPSFAQEFDWKTYIHLVG